MDYQDFLLQQRSSNLHFWYKARKQLIFNLCESIFEKAEKDALILDVGSGVGEELEILKKFGRVAALDKNLLVKKYVEEKGVDFISADLENFCLPKDKYDCVCCFDILEHIKNDQNALKNIFDSLKKGGCLLFTVPAYNFLFSPHDKALGHYRRYNKPDISKKLLRSGFKLAKIGCWNSFLFPAAAVFRLFKIFLSKINKNKPPQSDAKPFNKLINNLFYEILNWETKLSKRRSFPFGLSIFGIAKKF